MKVWGFNGFGICVALINVDRIEEWNKKYPTIDRKIVTWKKA